MGDLVQLGDQLSLTLTDPIPNPNPNPSRSEPNNFSFNSLLSFRSPIWTYNYPFMNGCVMQCVCLMGEVLYYVLNPPIL